MKVRAARGGDEEVLLGLRCALWPERDPQEQRRAIGQRIDSPLQHGLLVLEDGQQRACGFIDLDREPGAAGRPAAVQVEGIYVAPAARGQGGARLLLDAAERWAHGRGAGMLAFDLEPDSDAVAFAERVGFAGVRRTVHLERAVRAPLEVSAPGGGSVSCAPPAPPAPATETDRAPGAAPPARGPVFIVVNLALLGAAVASFLATDIFSRDPVRGLLLPLLDVAFVLYFMFLFVVVRYRKRADSSRRAAELFRRDE